VLLPAPCCRAAAVEEAGASSRSQHKASGGGPNFRRLRLGGAAVLVMRFYHSDFPFPRTQPKLSPDSNLTQKPVSVLFIAVVVASPSPTEIRAAAQVAAMHMHAMPPRRPSSCRRTPRTWMSCVGSTGMTTTTRQRRWRASLSRRQSRRCVHASVLFVGLFNLCFSPFAPCFIGQLTQAGLANRSLHVMSLALPSSSCQRP